MSSPFALRGLRASLGVAPALALHWPTTAWPGQRGASQRLPCLYSHLRHGLGQVGGDGGEAFATTIHNAVATGAHGWAGAGGEGAGRHMSRLPLACGDSGL